MMRARALLLLGLFFASGTTLPAVDILLYHWGKAAEPRVAHVEPAGGCAGHTEGCALGRAAAGAGAVLPHLPVIRAISPLTAVVEPRPRSVRPANPFHSLPPSRAPPVQLA